MNKNSAFLSQLVHNIAVMYDFPADINWSAEGFQCDLDDIDRAHNACAKAARLEQQHPLLTRGSLGDVSVRDGIEDSNGHISKYTNECIEGIEKRPFTNQTTKPAPQARIQTVSDKSQGRSSNAHYSALMTCFGLRRRIRVILVATGICVAAGLHAGAQERVKAPGAPCRGAVSPNLTTQCF